ncbi:MAG: hypothetical protein BRD45_02245 [Bacteroidetes bacterium QS_8_64_10]|nr:MAG: hypothetical protein BRD45_02245 [Bacteroidetes bacterium QS_8_64_10]
MSWASRCWIVVACATFWLAGSVARAQATHDLRVRRVKSLANGAVYELTADWRQPLSVALDSAHAERLTPDVARHVVSGVSVASKHLQLPALRKPQVRIVGTDYDEADLPADTIPDALTRPPAEVEGVGMERRRPAATLAFNALRYDKDARRLRRYRRIRVRVTFAEGDPQQARRKQTGPRMSMTNSHLSVERSALADGLIFKFPVTESGVYRITRDALAGLLEESDRSIGNIDPRKLQVLGIPCECAAAATARSTTATRSCFTHAARRAGATTPTTTGGSTTSTRMPRTIIIFSRSGRKKARASARPPLQRDRIRFGR